MFVYIKADDHAERARRIEEQARGKLAMYRALLAQRRYAGRDVEYPEYWIAEAEADLEAQRQAPPGTALIERMERMPGIIWVVDGNGKQVFFGAASDYRG